VPEGIPTSRRTTRSLVFTESLYLISIIKGMWITLRHVIHNLLKQDFQTIEYPEVRKPMPPRYKGAHRLTTRPDGGLKCVACMCCSQVCPARCIIIEAEETDHPIEKRPIEFQIDMLRCIFCGFCVDACPKDAIRMDTGIYEINAFTRQDMIHNKRYMVDLMDGGRPEAEIAYRDEPGMAPAGFRADEPRVLADD
jgi:NADH-quinone oxidoreductase subunit I